jgi:hypothetical protein
MNMIQFEECIRIYGAGEFRASPKRFTNYWNSPFYFYWIPMSYRMPLQFIEMMYARDYRLYPELPLVAVGKKSSV